MYKKFWLIPSLLCECEDAEQTTEHVLQSCKLLDASYQEGSLALPTSLATKLYWMREEVARTVKFIDRAGLRV